MVIPAIIFSTSILGLAAVFLRHASEAAALSDDGAAHLLQTRSLTAQAWHALLMRARAFWHTVLHPASLLFAVKAISRVRILTMRMEQMLFKISTRIRQRSLESARPPSAYLRELNGWRKTIKIPVKKPGHPRKTTVPELRPEPEQAE